MSEPTDSQKPSDGAAGPVLGNAPVAVNAQYIKDLSFENPRAPMSFGQAREQPPKVEVSVDVNVRRLQEKMYEVILSMRSQANHPTGPLFLAELHYAGMFTIGEVPAEAIEPILLIQGAQLLFPFARAILADCVRDGGFAPLMVHPIDFAALYMQRAQQRQAQADNSAAAGDQPTADESSETEETEPAANPAKAAS